MKRLVIDMSFVNKVVLVTGGSSGIGASAALAFTREGADVCIVGRNESRLAAVSAQCAAVGKTPLAITADLSRDEDVANIVSKVIDRHGKLDVLINNAGILRSSGVADENTIKVYDEVMNNNLRSVVLLTNLCVPWLEKTKGNIVNISSVAASATVPGHSAYSMSKSALTHFSKTAAFELAPKNIRVNVVSPGPVRTDIFETGKSDFTFDELQSLTALKKISEPEEIARVILFMASAESGSVTGSNYLVDCGYLAMR